jgi:uncharacterized protein (DUF305 family)
MNTQPKRSLATGTAMLAAMLMLALGGCAPLTPAAQAPADAAAIPAVTAQATEETAGQQAMGDHNTGDHSTGDHHMGDMGHGHGVVQAEGQPFDLAFIDGMIPHHEGAIVMAQQALDQAERDEVKQMAQAIIDAQAAEIEQLRAWRQAWYPDAPPADASVMAGMMMEVPAGEDPFDLRFIESMIPHHDDAITMAQQALEKAEHPEIKAMAQAIIDGQAAEIEQMQQWRGEWYPGAE